MKFGSSGLDRKPFPSRDIALAAVAFDWDGKRLASGSGDMTVKVWDAGTGQEAFSLRHVGSVSSVAFSPDGKRLATVNGGTVKVWNAMTGQEILAFKVRS